MDRLEQRLRSTLADPRLDLPVRPDATGLVKAGVRRRRRNRAIATVASAVVLLGGGIATASVLTASGGSERILPPTGGGRPTQKPAPPPSVAPLEQPWAATAYDYHRPPAFPGAVADATVPWCRASQLQMSQEFQGATGSWVGAVTVTNHSTSTCALQGQPAVSMQTATGHVLVSSHPEPFYVDAWLRLSPGRSASATVTWWPEFCHEPPVALVGVSLPHQGGALTTTMHGTPRCDDNALPTSAGRLDVDGFLQSQEEPFTPLAGLAAQLVKVPSSALPGGVLAYKLALQTAHATSVRMDPCLPFRERLVNQHTNAVYEQDFVLNCGSPPIRIGDGSSAPAAVFDLRIAVPASLPLGDYTLLWQSVLKPVATSAENVVHIRTGAPPCRDGQLTASDAGDHTQAMNQYSHTIVLRNISTTACSLRGYPGLTLVDGSGHTIGKDAGRGGGYVFNDPGPQTVVLPALTGTASFTFGGPAMTGGGQTPCPTSSAAVIYPPGLLHELRVGLAEPYCQGGIDVTAVVAGTRGTHY